METNWQNYLVSALVVLAGCYVVAKVFGLGRKRKAGACGSCGHCAGGDETSPPNLVPLDALRSPPRK
jgi:hypothetical protein